MNEGAHAQSLRAVLQELLTCAQALEKTLLAERTALSEHNLNTLNRHTEAKKDHLLRLEALELQRRQLLNSLGVSPGQDLILPGLDALWQAVRTALRACQEANEVNGAIVRTHHRQTQRALDLLAGRDGAESVYAANGLPASRSLSEEIAKA
ncbi:MAG: flagella synthesis protein FlgN [Pseudomonadales bacterium]